MFIRTYMKMLRFTYSKYLNPNDMQAQKLTRIINDTRSNFVLKKIIQQNSGKFNLIHISAILKKLKNKSFQQQAMMNLVYKQVKTNLKQIQSPNKLNARAIANVIGYTGNYKYHGIDEQIIKMDFQRLLMLLNEKQFVMAFTGILKLGLVDQVIKAQILNQIIITHVKKNDNFGLLISLWRNLIKSNKTNKQINNLFAKRLQQCSLSHHIKDLGYFVYCYTQTHQILQNPNQLLELINKCSQNILHETRINIYQFCIFVEHLAKLSQIQHLEMSPQFVDILNKCYVRTIREKVDLRSIANGFLSLQSFKVLQGKIDQECYCATSLSYVERLIQNLETITDYQSVTSLFVQLIKDCPQSILNFKPIDFLTQSYKYPLSHILDPTLNFAFNPKTKHIFKMSDKQYQKFFYGLYQYRYLYKKASEQSKVFDKFALKEQQIKMIKQSLFQRKNLSQLQLNSIMISLYVLDIKDAQICLYLRKIQLEKGYKIPPNTAAKNDPSSKNNNINLTKTIQKQCLMGLTKQQCGTCYNKNKENKKNNINN